MAIRRTGSQTLVNRGVTAAAATPVNIITGSGGGGVTVNISSIQIANSTFVAKDDTAIDTAGGFMIINGTGFQSGAVAYVQGTAATSTSFVSSSRLNVTVPALSSGVLDVYVVNTDGSGSIYLQSLRANGTPSWTTTSPLTGQAANAAFAINLVATGAAGDGTITYAVSSGSSLPPGTILSSNGYFYGTVSVGTETTYSFSVDAIDAQNQETARSFNITVQISEPYFNLTTLLLSGNGTNNANNNVFQDSSTNNFTITRNGNVTQGTYSPFSQTGWSNYFDGTGFLSFTNSTDDDIASGDFTIELWVYYPTAPSSSTYTAIYSKYSANTGFNVQANNANIRLVLGNGTTDSLYTFAWTPQSNTWYHIAITRSGTNGRVFLNGSQIGTTQTVITNNANSTNGVQIGRTHTVTDGIAQYISNARFVKGQALYTGSFTPATTPLTTTSVGSTGSGAASSITGTVGLLSCQSNRFIDNGSGATTISVGANVVSVQAFSPFAPTAAYSAATVGGSGYFDGTSD
jgi:hypothetical protein